MTDIRVRRAHTLGLDEARRVVTRWMARAEQRFGLQCSAPEGGGEAGDAIAFAGSGFSGRFVVAPDHFDVEATLGSLLGGFAGQIEAEIASNLDALIAAARPEQPDR